MMHNVKHISQRTSYKVWAEYSCGVAALLMILDYLQIKNKPSYYILGILLKVNIQRKFKNSRDVDDETCGVFEEDYVDYCKTMGWKNKLYRNFKYDELYNLVEKRPVVIGIKEGKYGHWATAIGIENGKILYFDPMDKRPIIKRLERKIFDGTVFELKIMAKQGNAPEPASPAR